MTTAFSKLALSFPIRHHTFYLRGRSLSAFGSEYQKGHSERDRTLSADCHSDFCYDAAMRGLGSIDSVSSILEGLARRLGLESKLLENRLRRDWVAIVGEPIASNTWPDQIRYKKLYLLVHNSVWLHQLTFLKPTLIQKLNTVAGTEVVTDIVLRVGELPKADQVAASPVAHRTNALPPSDALLEEISAHVTTIHDPVLRDHLAQLMAQSLAPSRPSKAGRSAP
ncbi:MAG: hypothetical protein A2V62_07215 [Nitrospirae bacterium RBG_19FT_COMBO_58_9]|nr:MAG: hypothetical protein A2V62_07215 [Nitrospirae bacterium RBG_19FT_COMBO_58_9]